MRTLAWGLTAGWFGGFAVVIGPVVLLTLSGNGFSDLDAVGGFTRYSLWALVAGTLIGATMGAARLMIHTDLGMRVAAGLVALEFFGTQFAIFESPGEGAVVPWSEVPWMVGMIFLLAFAIGPALARGLYASFPELHDWGAPDHERARKGKAAAE
jgi:hypothetical protein